MSGEGACFLAIPPGCDLRPADTGWYAAFDALSGAPGDAVPYSTDAFRFWGSTFDPSGLYRFNAVMDWLAGLGVTVGDIHAHAQRLESRFLAGLEELALPSLPVASLVPPAGVARGNFLAFDVTTRTMYTDACLRRGSPSTAATGACVSGSASITTTRASMRFSE